MAIGVILNRVFRINNNPLFNYIYIEIKNL